MLLTFPHLLDYFLLAPTFLRLALGGVFLYFAYKTYADRNACGKMIEGLGLRPVSFFRSLFIIVSLVGGIFLVIGLFVQVVALALCLLSAAGFVISIREREVFQNRPEFFFLLTFALLSLVFLYPGLWTVDIPV